MISPPHRRRRRVCGAFFRLWYTQKFQTFLLVFFIWSVRVRARALRQDFGGVLVSEMYWEKKNNINLLARTLKIKFYVFIQNSTSRARARSENALDPPAYTTNKNTPARHSKILIMFENTRKNPTSISNVYNLRFLLLFLFKKKKLFMSDAVCAK